MRYGTFDDFGDAPQLSSHELSLTQTYQLALALGRAPESVRVVTVDVADTSHGVGLTPAVRAAITEAVRSVERIIVEQSEKSADKKA